MRPVNLIPADQRREPGISRTGPLAYIVVGALAALLAGVVVIVLASNQISENEATLETLNARKAAAEARAERLSPYSKFQQVAQQRTTAVYELADSRFDWPRVLRQLSLVVPKYVVLGKLTGLAGPGAAEGEGGGSDLVAEIKSPSLMLEGCALNQKRVAALITALHQIDGVTRVGLGEAKLPEDEAGQGDSDSCTAYSFKVAVAFDAAPISPDLVAAGAEATTAPVSEEGSSESEPGSSGTESATKTEPNGSETTVSKTTTVNPPSN